VYRKTFSIATKGQQRIPAGQRRRPVKYTFALLGEDVVDGRQFYVLHVEPMVASKFLYRGTVFVDAKDYAVVQMQCHGEQLEMAVQRVFRWGIIGSGAITWRFVNDIRHAPSATVSAIWGRNTDSAGKLARECGAVSAASLDHLLGMRLDAVYIATLPDTHARYSLACLRAGKAVLCEKPVALNGQQLVEVLAVAAECRQLFMEAMKPPFFPAFQALRRTVDQCSIGTVRFIQSGFATLTPADHSSWNLATGGGSLLSIGVYHAWLAVFFMGDALAVQASGRLAKSGVDAFAAVVTTHAQGTAQIFSGLDLQTPGDALIVGDEGCITLHGRWWKPERISVTYNTGETVFIDQPAQGGGLNYEIEHFCGLLQQHQLESPIMTHAVSRGVMDVLDRAQFQIRVSFPERRQDDLYRMIDSSG